jgi:hypothetical protein
VVDYPLQGIKCRGRQKMVEKPKLRSHNRPWGQTLDKDDECNKTVAARKLE